MRLKLLGTIVILLSVFLGIVITIEKPTRLRMISSPSIYSIKYTNSIETFSIPLLINKEDSFYTDIEYIVSVQLESESELIPLSIEKINISDEPVFEDFYLVNFEMKLGFYSDDYVIMFDDALLHLTYQNNETYQFDIGEFYYVFQEVEENDLSLQHLQATYETYQNINTVSGVVLGLGNLTDEHLEITNIDVLGNTVTIHNGFITELYRDIDSFEDVSDILMIDNYIYDDYPVSDRNIVIPQGNEKTIYIPLLYHGEIQHIERFTIKITYEVDNEIKTMYIDDFPFMVTSVFASEYEEGFRTYELD